MKRKLYPGDKWLYVKIYASSVQCETLLITKIPQLISSLTKQSLIQKWFFIRYADPENHIRLRFLLSDTERIAVINVNNNSPIIERYIERLEYPIEQ